MLGKVILLILYTSCLESAPMIDFTYEPSRDATLMLREYSSGICTRITNKDTIIDTTLQYSSGGLHLKKYSLFATLSEEDVTEDEAHRMRGVCFNVPLYRFPEKHAYILTRNEADVLESVTDQNSRFYRFIADYLVSNKTERPAIERGDMRKKRTTCLGSWAPDRCDTCYACCNLVECVLRTMRYDVQAGLIALVIPGFTTALNKIKKNALILEDAATTNVNNLVYQQSIVSALYAENVNLSDVTSLKITENNIAAKENLANMTWLHEWAKNDSASSSEYRNRTWELNLELTSNFSRDFQWEIEELSDTFETLEYNYQSYNSEQIEMSEEILNATRTSTRTDSFLCKQVFEMDLCYKFVQISTFGKDFTGDYDYNTWGTYKAVVSQDDVNAYFEGTWWILWGEKNWTKYDYPAVDHRTLMLICRGPIEGQTLAYDDLLHTQSAECTVTACVLTKFCFRNVAPYSRAVVLNGLPAFAWLIKDRIILAPQSLTKEIFSNISQSEYALNMSFDLAPLLRERNLSYSDFLQDTTVLYHLINETMVVDVNRTYPIVPPPDPTCVFFMCGPNLAKVAAAITWSLCIPLIVLAGVCVILALCG